MRVCLLLVIMMVIGTLVFGCGGTDGKTPRQGVPPYDIITDITRCARADFDWEYITYSYDGVSRLTLEHKNAVFSCSPDEITAEAVIENGNILITQHEKIDGEPVPCLCFYSVNMELLGIEPGTYTIRITPLEFAADLSEKTEGSFYFERHGYPWGSQSSIVSIGFLVDYTGLSAFYNSPSDKAFKDSITSNSFDEVFMPHSVDRRIIIGDYSSTPFVNGKDMPSESSNIIAAYEWLKQQGADLIITAKASVAAAVKSRVNEDGIPLFALASTNEILSPPGYIFGLGTSAEYEVYTLLKWLSDHDPDFPHDRPAKIGGAFWNEFYSESILKSAEGYARAHPDKYEWVGGYLSEFGLFVWETEVEALKDCDYILPPIPMHKFIKDYRNAGYTNAKFICTSAHTEFIYLVDRGDLWDEVDGSLFVTSLEQWSDDGEMIDQIREMLYQNHPEEADEIIQRGSQYLSSSLYAYILSEIIAEAVRNTDWGELTGEAFVEATQSYSEVIDGCLYRFTKNKRTSNDALGIYEVLATEKTLYRAEPEWIPVVTEP